MKVNYKVVKESDSDYYDSLSLAKNVANMEVMAGKGTQVIYKAIMVVVQGQVQYFDTTET